MIINPGIGIGTIKFGITEKDLIVCLGEPDVVDEEEYIEGSGDWYRELWYHNSNISFSFDKEENYRLGAIAVVGSGYPLFGKELFNMPLSFVNRFVSKATGEIPKYEDWTSDEQNTLECLTHSGLSIIFWFESGNLSKMDCGVFFKSDNETIDWP